MTWSSRLRGSVLVVAFVGLGTAPAAAGEPVFHGIISQGYLNSSEYNYLVPSEAGTFAYNEVLLNVSSTVSDNLRVGAQFMGRNFGTSGNDDLVVDWAYGDWRYRSEFGLRVGKVKVPFGFYNQTRDVDMVRNAILLPQSVYTENFRDVINAFEGVSAYGSLGVGDQASLEYEVFVGTGDIDRFQVGETILNGGVVRSIYGMPMPIAETMSEVKTVSGGAVRFNTPLQGLRVGASLLRTQFNTTSTLFGPLGPFTADLKLTVKDWYVLSGEYSAEKLLLAAEYTRLWVNYDFAGIPVPTGLPSPYPPVVAYSGTAEDLRGGYYGMASWQFNDWFQLGGYYSVYYPDYNVRDGDFATRQKDLALTARFDLTDYWLLKLEAHFVKGIGDVDPDRNSGNSFTAEDWNILGVKSTFYF
jgi:hypothetical protein